MPIDLSQESLLPLQEAPKHVPGRPHISTIYRWITRKNNPLETVKVGGRVFTSVEAIHRFIAGCNQSRPANSTAARQHQIKRAEETLDAFGIKGQL